MRSTERHSFEALGEKLRNHRESVGLSLREVAEKTRIPQGILEGLESGNPTGLPAPVFIIGFLRSYSREIGISADEVIQEFKSQQPNLDRAVGVPITARREANGGSHKKMAVVLICVLILVGAFGAIYYYSPNIDFLANFGRKSQPAPPPASVSKAGSPDRELVASSTDAAPPESISQIEPETVAPAPPTAPAPAVSAPTSPRTQSPQPPDKPVAAAKGHELRVDFTKESWIQVMVDDKEIQHGLFGAGTSRTWKADDKLKIRIGNAGGVRVFFDGKEVDQLGPDGKAVSLTLPKPAI